MYCRIFFLKRSIFAGWFKSMVGAFLMLLYFIPFQGFGSSVSNNEINVLLERLKTAKEDTAKVNIYLKLGEAYLTFSPDSTLFFYEKGLALARKINSEKYIGQSLLFIGISNLLRGNYKRAMELCDSALEIFKKLDDEKGLIHTYNQIGNVYWKTGNFKEGIQYQLEALKLSELIENKPLIAQTSNDLGLLHWENKSLKKALEYFYKSLVIREKLNDKIGLSQAYNNIGLIYEDMGEKEKALTYYLKCFDISQSTNNKIGMTIAECNTGLIYSQLGKYKKSDKHFKNGLRLAKEIQHAEAEAVIPIYMAQSYIAQGKYKTSIHYGLIGLEKTKAINSLAYEKMAYEKLSIASDSLRVYKDAYKYYKLFKELNDSIFNEANSKQIVEMQTKYDTEKKERENELLKKNNELQQLTIKKETSYRNFLIVTTGLVLLLTILLYVRIQDRRKNEIILENRVKERTEELEKAKLKAEENDRLKSAFLANISHEIRTPMNGILGFAELLKRPKLSNEKQKEFIDKIEKSGERLLTIVNNLIEISRIESNQMEVVLSTVNVNEELETFFKSFKPEASEKDLNFSFSCFLNNNEAFISTDQDKFRAILNNLLKNALKFTLSGSIQFGYEKKGSYLEFFVKDTGIGISQDMTQVIFERFIQADLTSEKSFDGAGLGLSLSKAYTEMLGGKIWVESEYWMGSKFCFTIPYKLMSEKTMSHSNELRMVPVSSKRAS